MQFVETPIQAINGAIEQFILSCFVADAIGENRITPSTFREQIKLNEGGHGLNFKGVFTDAQLRADARNMILMALGTTAICANKAMEAVFGKTNPRDTGPFGSARVILYQIRCAFAHDPLNPVWTPNVKSYKHTYQITVPVPHASGKTINRTIKLHPPTLKNEHLGAADFGGLGSYMALLQYCLAKVEGHPKGNRPYPGSAPLLRTPS